MRRDLLASLVPVLLALASLNLGCTRPNPLYKWEAPCGGTGEDAGSSQDTATPQDTGTLQDTGTPQDTATGADHVAVDGASVDGPVACVTPAAGAGCPTGAQYTFEEGLGGWTVDSSASSGQGTTTSLALNRQPAYAYCGCGSLGFHVAWSRAGADGGDVVPPSAVSGIQLDLANTSVSLLDKSLYARIWIDAPGAVARAMFVTEAAGGELTKLGNVVLVNGSWVELVATGAPADAAKLRLHLYMAESTAGTAAGGQVSGQVYVDELGWR